MVYRTFRCIAKYTSRSTPYAGSCLQETPALAQETSMKRFAQAGAAVGRRRFTSALAGLLLLGGMATAAAANYPTQPIRIVVPWPAGGLVDLPARLLADKLQAELGVTVVVENKPGAGGTIGADAVAKAAPDGYTLMVTTSAIAINQAVGLPQPFALLQDFKP